MNMQCLQTDSDCTSLFTLYCQCNAILRSRSDKHGCLSGCLLLIFSLWKPRLWSPGRLLVRSERQKGCQCWWCLYLLTVLVGIGTTLHWHCNLGRYFQNREFYNNKIFNLLNFNFFPCNAMFRISTRSL